MSALLHVTAVRNYLTSLQSSICGALADEDNCANVRTDKWTRPEGGGGRTTILTGGDSFEKGGVAFSHVCGTKLPPSATAHRPELAGKTWEALGVSLVIHPRNPFVPTAHMNVRFFCAGDIWWFGGGFDLTPYYGFEEDCAHWHRTARDALAPFGAELHARFKKWCDDIFS